MSSKNITTSGFSLAKRQELVGDDFYAIKTIGDITVAIVCDGVGSAEYGKEAATKTVTNIMRDFESRPQTWSLQKCIDKFIHSVNTMLYQDSMANYERCELVTTIAIVVIQADRIYGANIGDSRVYLSRDGKLSQLSHDHILKEKGYENVLTQAMGIAKEISPYYFENNLLKDDKILLCSDGLFNVLDEDELKQNINLGANILVKKASSKVKDNLPDDTTAIVIDILEQNQVEQLKKQKLIIPESLKKAQVIDGYILEKSLIQNQRTWLATKDGKKFVLKFIPIEANDDNQILDAFVKEAWNSKRIKAEYFAESFIPEDRTYRYYVQEYIDGVDLKTYLKKRTLHVDEAIILAKTLLDMAQYLMKYDLVHADIKPENIMLIESENGYNYKIIDFGSMSEIYTVNSKAGTPSYLAPERFDGSSINECSEIFSISIVLYEALSNKFPYGEIEPFQNPLFENPKNIKSYNDNIPIWLESIIMRGISADTDLRYANYSEMLYEIQNSKKVKPFFDKKAPLLERNPLAVYKSIAFVELLIILYLLIR